MAKERAQKWVAQLEDPDTVGASEYRAIHELLNDIAAGADEEAEDALEFMDGVLDEVIGHAQALKDNLAEHRGKKLVLTDADRLANAAERVLATFGAMQDYERQGDRWDDEDHAALDALREAVRGKAVKP